MDKAKARARLDLSAKVIDGWENVGMSGRFDEKMKMIFDETQILFAIEREHPDVAAEAKAIGARYGKLALDLKLGSN